MLYIRKLFTQDLRDGKQIAFPKEPSYSFFSFDYLDGEEDRQVKFVFKAKFEQFQEFDGRVITTRLYAAGSESRMDGEVKAFIRDELGAEVDDLLIFKNKGTKYSDFEFMFVPKNNPYYSLLFKLCGGENHSVYCFDEKRDEQIETKKDYQCIYYGAPGTGKSFEINRLTEGKEVIRTTFHPDSDYSTFVGAYKPTSIEIPVRDVTGKIIIEHDAQVTENRIVYEFVEQAFLQAYIKAWNAYASTAEGEKATEQYLIIEEINRGNCAQIFGDLFQLLDRNAQGFSDYPITADKDIKKQLSKAFKDKTISNADYINSIYKKDILSQVLKGEVLLLPDNLYIWATMNTSDQSLFPIDSAFKRRWDWKYMPICEGRENGVSLGWKIKVKENLYDWWQFVEKINNEINEQTKSEDKKLGYFFCKADNGIITAETFVGKVVFYLWNDVFKDQAFASDIFQDGDEELTFNKFYDVDANGKAIVREDKVELFLKKLGVGYLLSNTDDGTIEIEDLENNNTSTNSKTTLKEIEFPDGTIIDSTSGIFDAYMHAIEKIGIDTVCSVADRLKYRRRGKPLISKEKCPELETDYGYSYYMMGDYYFLRGANTYTYVRILEDLNSILQLGMIIRN